ncbi:protein YgfX [Thioflexithrix psekupsensis]|uniref:YcxB-like protein domain-containing protein n=1 Tax=Thioflexithrix psekupsensis TaxID=1570016 RepID=A0A251X7F1_9GAMM|nr:protein YgfX [Thioflexithrix psekupsensis]OUD13552.1 hypothetical protein TPSD3_10200 [Thioflexithrix psekupsensis]
MLDEPIEIQLIPSKRLQAFSAVIHGGGCLCLWLSSLPWPLALLGSVAAFFSHYYQIQQQRRIDQHPLNHAVLDYDQFYLHHGDKAQATSRCIAHPWGIVLQVNTERQQQYTVIILPDALPKVEFRRLCVRLRYSFPNKIKEI